MTGDDEYVRTQNELWRTKYGDTLTHYDPPLDAELMFEVGSALLNGLVGYEFRAENGEKVLVGDVNSEGNLGGGLPRLGGKIVAGRKVWFR